MERPERCWIHPELKNELKEWHNLINKIAEERTGYPIQEGLPLASKICSLVLSKTRNALGKNDLTISKCKNDSGLKIEIMLGKALGDKSNLNIELQKKIGVKKNAMSIW